jgi:hypothetical protein
MRFEPLQRFCSFCGSPADPTMRLFYKLFGENGGCLCICERCVRAISMLAGDPRLPPGGEVEMGELIDCLANPRRGQLPGILGT